MTVPHTTMILAAGFGTRMGDLTRERPKPLLPVAGRPMIDLALDIADQAGAEHAVVNLHYLGDMIRAHLAGRSKPRVSFSEESPEILDTGGGVVRALPMLGAEPFWTLNSDAVFAGPNPLEILRHVWRPGAMDGLLLLVARDRTRAYTRPGDFFLTGDGAAPARRGEAPTAPFVYAGAQIMAPAALADTPEGPFSMNVIWDRLLTGGRLAAVTYPGDWVDVGTPDGLAEADRALAGQSA